MIKLKCNCCDGRYNSFDVHFTKACDNDCAHCIDKKFSGIEETKPNAKAIVKTITEHANGFDDVLFLGGEPCLFLDDLIFCVKEIKAKTGLKCYVTTSVPKTCYDNKDKFNELLRICDGVNLSTQSHDEKTADTIRRTKSQYDRQAFYASLPYKEKIRINLNIVKPFLCTREDLEACLRHYDAMGFSSIKLSEIQHGTNCYVRFEDIFGIKLKSPFSHGCQTWIDTKDILPGFKTPLLLKRSCFMCEKSLQATFGDFIKANIQRAVKPKNNYAVVYEDGTMTRGWV